MDFEKRVSLIVGLRNNLDYTIAFYNRVRALYQQVEIVFVSYGSTDGTHEWLDNLQDECVKYHYENESKSLSHTYNKGVELASSELVSYLHNDLIIGEGFVEELVKAWKKRTVLIYSLVEPPIFVSDEQNWKTIRDFGSDLETFDMGAFNAYVSGVMASDAKPFVTKDESFFLCVEKEWLVEMGGLDTTFQPMFCEDSDLMMRFHIQDAELIQVPKAVAYHFVSKTSRFSKEFEKKSKEIDELGIRNFYRKWRCSPQASFKHSYDLVAVVKNATPDGLYKIEPFFAKVYTDLPKAEYIDKYQHTTAIDLSDRIESIDEIPYHDVVVHLDEKQLTEKDYQRIRALSDIISRNRIKMKHPLKSLFKDYSKIKTGHISGKIFNFNPLERSFSISTPIKNNS